MLGLWACAVAAGVQIQWSYAGTPGDDAVATQRWPEGSKLARATDRSTLVLFAHPRCPCTKASLAELSEILAQPAGPVAATIVLVRPRGVDDAWMQGDIAAQARKLEGVKVIEDEEGVEAARFSALTSGAVVLYGKDGELLFSGGITGLRGHVGDNAGREKVQAALAGRTLLATTSPVFGCALREGREQP